MKLLLLGDVFGKPGRRAISSLLPGLIDHHKIDFVVANGENLCGGKGMTPVKCEELFAAGVDVISSGNHARDQKEIDSMLQNDSRLIRPLNYPETVPGRGFSIRSARNGKDVAVVNVMGRVHMGELPSPFVSIRPVLEEVKKWTNVVLVDFHAEATSEKRAMGWFLDGKVTAMIGTHTHIQTADEEVLPLGTAYLTDAGMTGPYDSVIGLRKDLAMERFLEGKKGKFEAAKGDVRLCGALIECDPATGRATHIERVQIRMAAEG